MKTASEKEVRILKEGRWIWPISIQWDIHNSYALFRKRFQIKQVPKRAPLHITADQSYQLYINGSYVCRGPARGFQKSWPYDTVDVAAHLKNGTNLIAIRAYNPGYSNFQYQNQGYAGLFVAAKWGVFKLLSDKTWKARRQDGVKRDMVSSSIQLFPQENIDLQQEDPTWCQPEFDDNDWNSSVMERTWNTLPWDRLEARGIPMLREDLIQVGKVIGYANGRSHATSTNTRNLTKTRGLEGLAHKAIEASVEEITFKRTNTGRWQSYLIDLGKLHVGSILLEIDGARGGETVETHHYETIDTELLCPDYDPDSHCRMSFSNRLICCAGTQAHNFYQSFGFRYLVLTVRDNKAPIKIKPYIRTTVYPIQRKGRFVSSDESLNQIWETCAWTEQVCSMDAYVDTPWREQAQWWGDARVQAWNTFHLSGDTRLFRRGMRQIATQLTPDGLTYGHAPTCAHGCVLPDFTLIWILTLWDYYWQTGSLEAFESHQKTIESALQYFDSQIHPQTGLLQNDPRYWLFLDWTPLPKEGCSSVYSLWYLHALDRLKELYTLSGKKKASKQCQQKARKLRKALKKLISPEGLLQDGYDPTGNIEVHTSIHSQTLAIMTGLSPKHDKDMLHKVLLPYIEGEIQPKITPSAYWITYLYSTLSPIGYGAEVISHLHKHWMPMVAQGTTWETFSPARGHESFSHAWSAHPLFHLMQIIGGVRQKAPGWNEISFSPVFIGNKADIKIPSPKGIIRSTWKRSGDTIRGTLKLPKGIQASVQMANTEHEKVKGHYRYELSDKISD